MTTLGRLKKPAQFADMILRATPDGRIIRIRDVGRVVLGAKNEDQSCRCNGLGSAGLIIFQLPDANALDVADRIQAKMEELAKNFPDDLDYVIRYDTTPFTRQCIEEVVKALRDAIILVALVVLLFLQNWRSAIIPLIAVPVAIIGTFAVMKVMGFSLNNLTLFGLVLAIGIVVDDAIVVVEAVEHHIENGLLPRDATLKAMSQVSGPVMAVGLVSSAVFVPCAFISGITGQFFRQFALTIAASTIISAFNSLTLSPALAALLLRPRGEGATRRGPAPAGLRPGRRLGGLATWRAAGWPRGWKASQALPAARPPRRWRPRPPGSPAVAGAAAGWLAGAAAELRAGPGFPAVQRRLRPGHQRLSPRRGDVAPHQRAGAGGLLRNAGPDLLELRAHAQGLRPHPGHGILLVAFQLPDAASAERTRRFAERVEKICKDVPGVKNLVAYNGQSFLLSVNGSNFGSMFVMLDDFERRQTPDLYCRRDRRPAAAEAAPRRCPRPWSSSSGRRRSAAWAARAGSSSWWKTGETSV